MLTFCTAFFSLLSRLDFSRMTFSSLDSRPRGKFLVSTNTTQHVCTGQVVPSYVVTTISSLAMFVFEDHPFFPCGPLRGSCLGERCRGWRSHSMFFRVGFGDFLEDLQELVGITPLRANAHYLGHTFSPSPSLFLTLSPSSS